MQERIIKVAFDVRLFMGTPVQNRKIAHVHAAQKERAFLIQSREVKSRSCYF